MTGAALEVLLRLPMCPSRTCEVRLQIFCTPFICNTPVFIYQRITLQAVSNHIYSSSIA